MLAFPGLVFQAANIIYDASFTQIELINLLLLLSHVIVHILAEFNLINNCMNSALISIFQSHNPLALSLNSQWNKQFAKQRSFTRQAQCGLCYQSCKLTWLHFSLVFQNGLINRQTGWKKISVSDGSRRQWSVGLDWILKEGSKRFIKIRVNHLATQWEPQPCVCVWESQYCTFFLDISDSIFNVMSFGKGSIQTVGF